VARAELGLDHEVAKLLVSLQRDLYVVMAELATLPENHSKLRAGHSLVTEEMVSRLEGLIDHYSELFAPPTEFVIPGETRVAAQLDVARTVTRRAERLCVGVAGTESFLLRYLNRLSDLLWVLARWQEGESRLAKDEL
jgi:cob(I)alamin adenosyltransferase